MDTNKILIDEHQALQTLYNAHERKLNESQIEADQLVSVKVQQSVTMSCIVSNNILLIVYVCNKACVKELYNLAYLSYQSVTIHLSCTTQAILYMLFSSALLNLEAVSMFKNWSSLTIRNFCPQRRELLTMKAKEAERLNEQTESHRRYSLSFLPL